MGTKLLRLSLLILPFASGQAKDPQVDLTDLNLEKLMEIEVTSVSKKTEKIAEAAAAIFVITEEDIHRSGVTSIPEALRLAPGIEAARIDASKWAITARGFNDRFANKFLVMIDGRSVYAPMFAGVYWEEQAVSLEDIERIEVIRGPGASLWGANAVNGIINIITKNAKDTQGGLATIGVGTEERGHGNFRYGGSLGQSAHYRLYAKYFDRDDFIDPSGSESKDDWDIVRGGFRMDWLSLGRNSFTWQGEAYDGAANETLEIPSLSAPYLNKLPSKTALAGGNVFGRWTHTFSTSSEMACQLYYARTKIEESNFRENRNVFDLDCQHRFTIMGRQEIVWGVEYRFMNDHIDSGIVASFMPKRRDDRFFSAFLQDEIALSRVKLMLGSKFEHNDYTGVEIQPNVRFLWAPNDHNTLWASIARAVRTPSRADRGVIINSEVFPQRTAVNPSPWPAMAVLFGDQRFSSERLIAYELGYRVKPHNRIYLDFAGFYNVYENLRTGEVGVKYLATSLKPWYIVVPIIAKNKAEAQVYGFELYATWQPLNSWRLSAAYSHLQMQLQNEKIKVGDYAVSEDMEGASPRHQFSIRSSTTWQQKWGLDWNLRFVDKLPSKMVKSYFAFDAHLSWKAHRKIEFSILGQNLLEERHREFGEPNFVHTLPEDVQRRIYGAITWRF